MSSESLVSIIMPAYNPGAFIWQAVDSVLAQTWPHWELIIVDDGSTDETGVYLDSLVDPRIRVIHQKNQGVSVARNTALDMASGKFITFLDADDVLPPESLRVRSEFMSANSNIDIVDGVKRIYDQLMQTEYRRHSPTYRGQFLRPLLKLDSSVFCMIPYMLKRALIGNIRFKSGMTHSEDLLFFIQLACHQKMEYGCVSEVVYHYRTGHNSAMKNMPGLERGYFTLIEEVRRLPCVTLWRMAVLRLKIAKILLLSWGAAQQWRRGMQTAMTCLIACRGDA
ncbi:MAG: glycosyltransferase family 2 protein [Limnohabitans sp.]